MASGAGSEAVLDVPVGSGVGSGRFQKVVLG